MTQDLIRTNEALNDFCARLQNEKFLAVDTEFMRERTYYPQLCLIQVAGTHEAAAIDALVPELDLTPFWQLLGNPDILKVFHAPRQDIEIFVHLSGAVPESLFDTQIAAMALGYPDQVSYAKLAESLTGTIIDKEEQFTDWTIRPLRATQIDYALQDVTVLRKVYTGLQQKLEELGRMEWFLDEMTRLNKISTYRVEPEDAWQRLKLRSNKPSCWAALRTLAAWRENEAIRQNRPRQMILKDDVLSQLALSVPVTRENLLRTRGLPNSLTKEANADMIVSMMVKAKQAGSDAIPPRVDTQSLNSHQEDQLDLLRLALKIVARQQNITPRLLGNTEDLSALILGQETCLKQGWRFELFGQQAQALLDGTMAISTNGLVVL